MSFNIDIENTAADAASIHYKDFPEFETLSKQIESLLYTINNNQLPSLKSHISNYDKLFSTDPKSPKLNKLGYSVTNLTEKITTNYKLVNQLAQKINVYLKECELNHEDEDSIGYLRQKEGLMINLIKSSLKTYQAHQKKFEILQQKTVKIGRDDMESTTAEPQESSGQIQDQVQITYEPVNAEELEQQTLLIQEREREIEQIGQDITYINEIYSNLDDIVQEQQFTIDTIEDNILRYSDDVHGASNELRRAERYQRRSGGRMLCCLFILMGVLGMIILIGVIF